ncbi:MAG TPA: HipA domain-containing protein [Chitinophagales bacterium]|nr:HipA domain-containing protein [Chitinophagales bacterium]
MEYCYGCLKENVKGFCSACEKRLFNRSKISHQLKFNWEDISKVIDGYPAGFSISGVQTKGFIGKATGTDLSPFLTNNENSIYIIKPLLSRFDMPSDSPANEHVTMQMAKQLFGIRTAECCLMKFANGSPAYVTRRFDYNKNEEKLNQEDFASILQARKNNDGSYKYNAKTYEDLGAVLSPLNKVEFIRILIFNFLTGNGDAHLKNFSLLETSDGDMQLSPSYDLMNTKIHINDSPIALNLFKELERTNLPRGQNYSYQIKDFIELGKRLEIRDRLLKNIVNKFEKSEDKMKEMINKSFLSDTAKTKYLETIQNSFKQLFSN